jgi:molybdopterin synthase sulfur carrier subunit
MRVQILAFGIVKEIAGTAIIQIDVAEGATAGALKTALITQYPKLGELKSLMIAVNQTYAHRDLPINGGDEVAIIPPVSGG